MKKILCYIRETECGHEQYVRRGCDKEFDLHERESVYCIGGSVMRGYFRLAHSYKKNEKWRVLKDVVEKHVVTPMRREMALS